MKISMFVILAHLCYYLTDIFVITFSQTLFKIYVCYYLVVSQCIALKAKLNRLSMWKDKDITRLETAKTCTSK